MVKKIAYVSKKKPRRRRKVTFETTWGRVSFFTRRKKPDDKKNFTGVDEALKRVIKIRRQRRRIYGDNWKDVAQWEHLAFLKEKVRRLENLTFAKKNNNYEKVEDTLIDICVYSLFALQNSIDKKGEIDDKTN